MNPIAVLLFATATIAPAATTTAPAEGPVARLEHAWLAALREHDSAALRRILADDFIDIDVHGRTRDKAAALAGHVAPSGTTQTLHDLRVRHYGDSAIVTGVNEVHSTTRGWTVQVAFTDVFVRRDGHWHAVSAQETLRSPAHPAAAGESSP